MKKEAAEGFFFQLIASMDIGATLQVLPKPLTYNVWCHIY
ncbi:hypothetical protein HMPREF9413_4930 [Paenibacillus sp. HGF7]|nr:hypothetical protein HMPREF9413_4930 [Paenibacillus sp. HGF7]